MRILHVLRDTDRRSSQVFAHQLCEAMERLGHDASVVALVHGDVRPGLEVEILGSKPDGVSTTWALRSRMADVDITIAHGPEVGQACVKASGRGRPFIYRQQRDTRFWKRRPSPPRRAPSYFRKAEAVIALSPGALRDLAEILDLSDTTLHAVPLGVPSDPFQVPTTAERAAARSRFGLGADQFVAATVGSLVPDKCIDVAIRAVRDLPDVHLAVAGDGPERVGLERLAEGLAPGKVTFLGAVADVRQVYAAADLLVHPSAAGDSMPAVLIEAGYCELAVIASAIGSIDEVIDNGRTGLLVPADDEEGLRQTIELMRIGRVGREQMGRAARERCLERFDLDVVAKEWMSILERVAASTP